jgi:hypothetical protein
MEAMSSVEKDLGVARGPFGTGEMKVGVSAVAAGLGSEGGAHNR